MNYRQPSYSEAPYSLLSDSYYQEEIELSLPAFYQPYLREALRIVSEERQQPNETALADSLRAETARFKRSNSRLDHPELAAVFVAVEQRALDALALICSQVTLPEPVKPQRLRLRVKARVSGSLLIEKRTLAEGFQLSWRSSSPIKRWSVQVACKEERERDYRQPTERQFDGSERQLVLQLDPALLYRIQVVGRSASGRAIERALIISATAENWEERWERRASAS